MTSVNNMPLRIKMRLLFCRGHTKQRRVWKRSLPRVLALAAALVEIPFGPALLTRQAFGEIVLTICPRTEL